MRRSAAEIFHTARELPADKRDGYLLGACDGDAALRGQVDSLLRADAAAGGFMASPTAGAHARADATPSQEQAGAQIGRYKLLEQIGEAGMGSIWMAVLSIIRNRGHLIVTRGFALLRHEAEVA